GWDEPAAVWSPTFLNAAPAVATGAVSWALWPMAQRIAEAVDAKLPPGVGRGLGAAVSGGLVALTAAGIDAIETWAEDDEESDWGPVEIELPTHIRESVELLLSQPHPVSPAGAEAVREQFDSAQFFVWVTYPNSLRSGDEPIALDPQQVTELLDGEDVTWIDVRPAASTPTAVPATQTYPVSGTTDGGSPNDDGLTSGGGSTSSARLSLDIVDGRLRRLGLSDMDDEAGDMLTPAALRDSVPGTLHPEKDDDITGCSCSGIGACDEEARTLERWPHPEALTVRVDGQRADREHAGGEYPESVIVIRCMSDLRTLTLGAGCFWCLDAVYQRTAGVTEVISGYTGGHTDDPGYREVCSGTTGHAEALQVTFDAEVVP